MAVYLQLEGVAAIKPLGKVSDYEKSLIEKAIPELQTNIERGVNFISPSKL